MGALIPACGDSGPSGPSEEPHPTGVTQQAAGVIHTVCPSGSPQGPCEFTSPAACAVGASVADDDICLVKGGTYYETVTYSPGYERKRLVFRCDVGAHCVIDGGGVRSHGFTGYLGWMIEGFEITGTVGTAVTGDHSAGIRDSYVHDIEGSGIYVHSDQATKVSAVVERNVFENIGGLAIGCLSYTYPEPVIIKNNLIVTAALGAIGCHDLALVTHNTIDLRDCTPPWAGGSNGIGAGTVRYNVVAGGMTSISAGTSSSENLVFGWGWYPYQNKAPGPGDVTGNPLFIGLEDYHLQAASPAVGTALSSTETEDSEKVSRPQGSQRDKGAFEHVSSYIAKAPRWPVREDVESLTADSAPALAYRPGLGPMMVWLADNPNQLRFAQRQSDGTWRKETVAATPKVWTNDAAYSQRNPVIGVEPGTNIPVIAWVQEDAGQLRIHYARRVGDACGTGCSSPQWSGCDAITAGVSNADAYSLSLEFAPDNRPTLALWHRSAADCSGAGSYNVRYLKQDSSGTWNLSLVESSAPGCTEMIPPGLDLSFSPVSGEPEIAFQRTTGNTNNFDPQNSKGVLKLASQSAGAWSVSSVPLGTSNATCCGNNSHVAIAHQVNGDLGIALSATTGPVYANSAVGFIERKAGVWDASMQFVRSSYQYLRGLAMRHDTTGMPLVAFTSSGNFVQFATRPDGVHWQSRWVDFRRDTGAFLSLALTPANGVLIGEQQIYPDKRVKLLATVDPGGIAPSSVDPTVCDLCPSDPVKTAPGQCGCGYPENPQINVNDVAASEATAQLQFSLSLSSACGSAVTVSYATGDGTASAGSDYDAKSGQAQFAPGSTEVKVPITVTNDSTYEPDETLVLSLSNPTNGLIQDGSGTGTIQNDDAPCTTNADCNDSLPCTADTCSSGACQNTAIIGCCTTSADCNDSLPCTADACNSGACQNTVISGCCTTSAQCDDNDPCTTDTCNSSSCQNAPISGCGDAGTDADMDGGTDTGTDASTGGAGSGGSAGSATTAGSGGLGATGGLGGSGGTITDGSTGGGSGGKSGGAGAPDAAPGGKSSHSGDDGGCGCRVAPERRSARLELGLFGLALALRRRRVRV